MRWDFHHGLMGSFNIWGTVSPRQRVMQTPHQGAVAKGGGAAPHIPRPFNQLWEALGRTDPQAPPADDGDDSTSSSS